MGSNNKMPTMLSELMCLTCGNFFPIQRKLHKLKEENHQKKLWCYQCKERTNHVEKIKASIELRTGVSAGNKDAFIDTEDDWASIFGVTD